MTREDFFRVLREGGSVVYNGFLVKTVADIPSEAELAKGNPDAEAEAKANILAEMDRLKADLALLKTPEVKEEVKGRKAEAADAAAAPKS